MTQLSVRLAAERVGVTRQTLFKKIKDGELSATIDHRGNKQIDVSELMRVYGALLPNDSKTPATPNKARQSKTPAITSDLQLDLERAKMELQFKERELQLAQERIDELRSREAENKQREREGIEERMRLLGVIETQNRLLAAPASSVTKASSAKSPSSVSPSKKSGHKETVATKPVAKKVFPAKPAAKKTPPVKPAAKKSMK